MREAFIHVNGVPAGVLKEESPRRFVFTYYKDYLNGPFRRPVCLGMPLREEPYISDSLFPFFTNLLSEGSNREFQARLHGLDPEDDFGLLLATASYDTIGNVTVKQI